MKKLQWLKGKLRFLPTKIQIPELKEANSKKINEFTSKCLIKTHKALHEVNPYTSDNDLNPLSVDAAHVIMAHIQIATDKQKKLNPQKRFSNPWKRVSLKRLMVLAIRISRIAYSKREDQMNESSFKEVLNELKEKKVMSIKKNGITLNENFIQHYMLVA